MSTVTKRRRNSFGLCLNMPNSALPRKRGTHLADSFFMPNVSCRTFCMRSVEIFTKLAISLIFTQWSVNTISWILLTIFSIVTSIGRPGRSSSKMDVSATLKFVVQYLSHRRCVVLIYGMQLFFDFFTCLLIQKQESNHRPILLFLHDCKQAQTRQLSIIIKTKLTGTAV